MKPGRPGPSKQDHVCLNPSCGKTFTAYIRKDRKVRFCSHKCYGQWLSAMHKAVA